MYFENFVYNFFYCIRCLFVICCLEKEKILIFVISCFFILFNVIIFLSIKYFYKYFIVMNSNINILELNISYIK